MSRMKEIWEKVAKKGADGKKYITYAGDYDLEYLYNTGFVDTSKYTLEEWKVAFAESRQPNGSYKLNEKQWMEKQKYHYEGPIDTPFDPATVREGDYTREQLADFFKEFVLPHTVIKPEQLEKIMGAYAEKGRFKEGLLHIDAPFKEELRQLLDTYASPLRRLQIDVQKARKKKKVVLQETQVEAQSSAFKKDPAASKLTSSRLDELVFGKKK